MIESTTNMNIIDGATEPIRLQLEHYYNASIAYFFQNDEQKANLCMNILIVFGLYWTVGLFYTYLDIFQKPKWILQYKIQPNKSQVTKQSLVKAIGQILINQTISFLMAFFYLKYHHGKNPNSYQLPTLTRLVLQWTFFVLIREVLFYYSHRILHHKTIYKHIHKQHHEWQTPIAIVSVYCHPLEHILSNVIPVLVGPQLMPTHKLIEWLWIAYIGVSALHKHSGYHFPFTFSPVFHDFHHLKSNVNYGVLGLLDRLHGTDKLFRQSKYFKDHRIYFSWSSPHKIQPFDD